MSDSVASIRTAVASGLAVSALPAGALTPDIQVIDNENGFSKLPPVELAIHMSDNHTKSEQIPHLVDNMCQFIENQMDGYQV